MHRFGNHLNNLIHSFSADCILDNYTLWKQVVYLYVLSLKFYAYFDGASECPDVKILQMTA